jgi:uncharacterized protein
MIDSPVYDPAHEGDVERVEEWLKANPGAINHTIGDGFSLLHVAAMFGHTNLVTHLIGRNALLNVNAENASRSTPLHLAAAFRDEVVAERIVRELVEFGAELNSHDANGQTPLHHAVARGSKLLARTLIELGADPHLKDGQARSAMDLAKDLVDGAEDIREVLRLAHHRSVH